MPIVASTVPDPPVSAPYTGANTYHRHHEGIVLSLCSDTREVEASEDSFLSVCSVLSTVARGRESVSQPAGSEGPGPLLPSPPAAVPPSSHRLAHVEDTADGCPGVRRAFFFFFLISNVCLKPVPLTVHD